MSLRSQKPVDSYILANAMGTTMPEALLLAQFREVYGRMRGLEDTLREQRDILQRVKAAPTADPILIGALSSQISKLETAVMREAEIKRRFEMSSILYRVLVRERTKYSEYETASSNALPPQTRDARETKEFSRGYNLGCSKNFAEIEIAQQKSMEYAEHNSGEKITFREQRMREAEEEELRRREALKKHQEQQLRAFLDEPTKSAEPDFPQQKAEPAPSKGFGTWIKKFFK